MAKGYVYPLKGGYTQGRTDQGVDFKTKPGSKIYAIGDGVVVFTGRYQGFGNYFAYRLTSGPAAGRIIFVAEHSRTLVKNGQKLRAGQAVAVASGGLEIGFAKPQGGTYLPAAHSVYHEGDVTQAGQEFASFLTGVGHSYPGGKGTTATTGTTKSQPAGASSGAYVGGGEIPPGAPGQPEDTVPGVYAPGSGTDSSFGGQSLASMWQTLASQPLASPESQSFLQKAQLANSGTG